MKDTERAEENVTYALYGVILWCVSIRVCIHGTNVCHRSDKKPFPKSEKQLIAGRRRNKKQPAHLLLYTRAHAVVYFVGSLRVQMRVKA